MSSTSRTPCGGGLETVAAGREGKPARSGLSVGHYHKRGRQSTRRPKFLVAVTPQGARTSGALVERNGGLSWVRKVDSERHMLRLPEPCWAVDEAKLREAVAAGATRVEVHDEQGRVWWTPASYLLAHGKRFDRGWGSQVRLRLSEWSFLPADSVTPHQQLGLFAEVHR